MIRHLLAGSVAAAAGFLALGWVGFSRASGVLPDLLGEDASLLDPASAVATAGVFGVTYLVIASALRVGIPLRRRRISGS